MPRLDPVSYDAAVPVDGYGPGFFRVAGAIRRGGLLLWPGGSEGWRGYDDVQSLLALAAHVDFVLTGTGAEIAQVPSQFRSAMEAAGIGVEIMATPTACRSYNVLLSEGRRVALAALPMP